MSRKADREELRRLRSWKADAMTVLARWDEVADRVTDMPLGEFKSIVVGRELDRLYARIAELEARPPHPWYLPWAKLDPTTAAVIVRTDQGWVQISVDPPEDTGWSAEAWEQFKNIGPIEPPT